ncbi:uncharacterized protein DDB_G0283357-like [Tribolium madens]|uniref:uncharacterized protein DDB_G0283357-like n=1 Tax=Tribolium madens TaxID=41895 RepID=UPI001CF758E8|nr:uncharacterized protein DDB_G0283357-like [Tribolium madens]
MWSRCSVVFCLFLTAQSAVLKTRNIPVEIVYDRTNPATYGTRNLDAKIQLSSDELLKLKLSDDIINAEKIDFEEEEAGSQHGVENLNEKNQLSPEEIGQSVKFSANAVEVDENVKAAVAEASENSAQSGNLIALLKRAEEMAYAGINTIRENFDKASESIPGAKPTAEAWEKLNQTLHDYFRDQYKSVLSLKQDQPTNNNTSQNQNQFMQNLINGFQAISNNFMSNYFPQNGQNQKPTGSEDEQQPQQQQGPWQSFVNFFQGGMNQIINNMNNINRQNSTGQEDTGTDSNGGSNFINTFVSSIQQFFQGQGSPGNNPIQSINLNQSDTGVTTNAPGFFQGAINQFNQVVNNFRPSTSARPPVQGDEGSSTTPGNFIQSIGQAFQNVNIFRPPGGQGGQNQQGGSNPIQSIGSQFGGQGGNGSNPFVSGAQAIGSQFGQAIGGQGGQNGSNPLVSGAQAIGNQFQQAIGNKPVEGGTGEVSTEKTRTESLEKEGEKVEKKEMMMTAE